MELTLPPFTWAFAGADVSDAVTPEKGELGVEW